MNVVQLDESQKLSASVFPKPKVPNTLLNCLERRTIALVEGGKVLTRNLSHLEIDDGREEGAMAPATYLTLAWLEFSLSEKLPV